MYLTYEEYSGMGGQVDFASYPTYEFAARAQIDYYTFNRLQNEEEYPEAVKFCMFELITAAWKRQSVLSMAEAGADSQAGITSQSNDGVSISYNVLSASEVYEALNTGAEKLIRQYLSGVKNSLGHSLLYRGVYPNEL